MNDYIVLGIKILIVLTLLFVLAVQVANVVMEYRWCAMMAEEDGIHAIWTWREGCKLIGNPLDWFDGVIEESLQEG